MDPKEDASVGVNTENHHGEPPLVPAEIDDDPLTSSRFSRSRFLNRTLLAGGMLGASSLGFGTRGASAAFLRPRSSAAQNHPQVLKFSMSAAADSAEGRAAVRLASRISHLTKGQVGMRVYPNFTLAASDADQIQQLIVGALDIAAVSIWTNLATAGAAFDLPYAFSTLGQVRAAFAGPPGNTVQASASALGVKILEWWTLTWRNLYGSKPIYTPNDLKGVKIRTQGTKVLNAFFAACGAFPQSIDSKEVYLALQTKQIDLVESSFQYCLQQKHYEYAKYGSADHHGISTWALAISNKTWDKLTPPHQKAVQQAFSESIAPHDADSTKYVATLVPQLKQDGMKINTPNRKPFAQIAKQIYPTVITSDEQKQVLSQLQAMGFANG